MEFEPDSVRGSYRECLRNHAASLGSYATDGCGEFSPAAQGGLTCAACGCHRNFHRKVVVAGVAQVESEESERAGKRRARTKFSPEQKERMLRFAEKIGWRIQRRDKEDAMEIHRFCREIGVSRQVFKVWMHNHKNNNASSASSAREDHDHHSIHGLSPMSQ